MSDVSTVEGGPRGIYKLPPELWKTIALWVWHIDEDWRNDESESLSDEEEDENAGMAVEALASTCKTFYDVCLPLLWSRADFETEPVHTIDNFIRLILPKYGHFFQELYFRVQDEDGSDVDSDGDSINRVPSEDRERRFKQLLVCFAGMPGLIDVNIDFDSAEFADELILKTALASQRETIRRLVLDGFRHDIIRPAWVAEVVKSLDQLRMLDLTYVGPPAEYDDASLAHAFNASTIDDLKFDSCDCFTPTFARELSMPTLKRLSLDHAMIDPDVLNELLNRIAPHIETLDLTSTPHHDEPLSDGPDYMCVQPHVDTDAHSMPKLHALRLIDTGSTTKYFMRFAKNPVQRLAVGPFDDDRLGWDDAEVPHCLSDIDLVMFISTKTAMTELKILTLHGAFADQDSEMVKASCEARGVEYRFELEPYDDETDEDDEDSMGLDLDEPDEWSDVDEDEDDGVDDFGTGDAV